MANPAEGDVQGHGQAPFNTGLHLDAPPPRQVSLSIASSGFKRLSPSQPRTSTEALGARGHTVLGTETICRAECPAQGGSLHGSWRLRAQRHALKRSNKGASRATSPNAKPETCCSRGAGAPEIWPKKRFVCPLRWSLIKPSQAENETVQVQAHQSCQWPQGTNPRP